MGIIERVKAKSGVGRLFFIWRARTSLPVNAVGLSLAYLDVFCALGDRYDLILYRYVS